MESYFPTQGDEFVRGLRQLRRELRDAGVEHQKAHQAVLRWRREHADILPQPASEAGKFRVFGTRYWEHECGFKHAYVTLDAAVRQATELLQQEPHLHDMHGALLCVYQCRWCDWFHVGHLGRKSKSWPAWVADSPKVIDRE